MGRVRKERFIAKGKNRLRVLRTGETQRPDGLYVFSYINRQGKQKHAYSWRLEESDYTPEGKREKVALRTLEAKIKRDLADINYKNIDVIGLVEKYISTKIGLVRHNTYVNYNYVLNIIKGEDFGYRQIDTVTISMAKDFLQKLQRKGKSCSTVRRVRGVLRPAFQIAWENDWVRKNPFEFQMVDILINDSVKREAISVAQQIEFLRFIREDKHFSKYYDVVKFLFETGLRISEFCGLTISDFNFNLNMPLLKVSRQLHRHNKEYFIEKPKTACGERTLVLSNGAANCLLNLITNRKKPAKEPVIGGISGFLCLNEKNDMPLVAYHWEKYFQHIIEKYNKTYKNELPKITPHVCRHTYCTNMMKGGSRVQTISYLMGHADKKITLNVYTNISLDNSLDAIANEVRTVTCNPFYRAVLN